ncbi:retinol dehydrogenase 14-like [Ornithodoros turicata]|uniref:retinol dehydrogenase 14-like n=1 Tax=Ornithodoros turicata TaxID=34597 RepID=UPI003139394C
MSDLGDEEFLEELTSILCLVSEYAWVAIVIIAQISAVLSFIAFIIWLYCRITVGRCKCLNRVDGKTVLITGGCTGIGFETAKTMAARGGRVIFTCRNLEYGELAQQKIIEQTGNTEVFVKRLDLASIPSVRFFAKQFLETEKRLDILIANAGRTAPRQRTVTNDGFEITIQSNHLGHFLLVNLLLDLIKKSAPARIVVVSSMIHRWATFDIDDFFVERHYSQSRAYGISKLLNIYFARELSDRLRGCDVTVNSLHPGLVKTKFYRDTPHTLLGRFLVTVAIPLFSKSPTEGAQTSIHLSLSPELEHTTGKYFMDCKETRPVASALNPVLQRKVWETSEKCLGSYCHF